MKKTLEEQITREEFELVLLSQIRQLEERLNALVGIKEGFDEDKLKYNLEYYSSNKGIGYRKTGEKQYGFH